MAALTGLMSMATASSIPITVGETGPDNLGLARAAYAISDAMLEARGE